MKDRINITGYSRGADAANQLARKLDKLGIAVDKLRLIDPVKILGKPIGGPQRLTVPDNVKQADNYYQRNGNPFSGGPMTNPSSNRRNHDMTDEGVDHNTIVRRVLNRER